MSNWLNLIEVINGIPEGQVFSPKILKKRATFVTQSIIPAYILNLVSQGYVERIDRGRYKRVKFIPSDSKMVHYKNLVDSGLNSSVLHEVELQPEQNRSQSVKSKNVESFHGADEGQVFMGGRIADPILELLKTGNIPQLLCNDGVTFKACVKGYAVERDFEGNIIKFELTSISITLCDGP